jgi:hypothetical protein
MADGCDEQPDGPEGDRQAGGKRHRAKSVFRGCRAQNDRKDRKTQGDSTDSTPAMNARAVPPIAMTTAVKARC